MGNQLLGWLACLGAVRERQSNDCPESHITSGDEPTTGLHFADVAKLLEVLFKLRESGNTLVVIEHNLDVIKTADWVIDLGPEGGGGGGRIVAEGPPGTIAAHPASHTGHYLKRLLAAVAERTAAAI